jgi:hypothetical protein
LDGLYLQSEIFRFHRFGCPNAESEGDGVGFVGVEVAVRLGPVEQDGIRFVQFFLQVADLDPDPALETIEQFLARMALQCL